MLGKIVRINADGTVPADNPFMGQATVRPEIWVLRPSIAMCRPISIPENRRALDYGARAPRRRRTQYPTSRAQLRLAAHLLLGGLRRCADGRKPCAGMEQPIYYWDPVSRAGDMDFYRGDLFPWRGDILVAGLRSQQLVRLRSRMSAWSVTSFALGVGRIRDVAESEDGVWIITDEDNGRILRLMPRR